MSSHRSIFFLPEWRIENEDHLRRRNEPHRPEGEALLLAQRRLEPDVRRGRPGRRDDDEVAGYFRRFFGAVVASAVDFYLKMFHLFSQETRGL